LAVTGAWKALALPEPESVTVAAAEAEAEATLVKAEPPKVTPAVAMVAAGGDPSGGDGALTLTLSYSSALFWLRGTGV